MKAAIQLFEFPGIHMTGSNSLTVVLDHIISRIDTAVVARIARNGPQRLCRPLVPQFLNRGNLRGRSEPLGQHGDGGIQILTGMNAEPAA